MCDDAPVEVKRIYAPLVSPKWSSVQDQLNTLPVFTVANKEKQPLQYEVGGAPVGIFYADVEAAKKELASARQQYPELDCTLAPVGLGSGLDYREKKFLNTA